MTQANLTPPKGLRWIVELHSANTISVKLYAFDAVLGIEQNVMQGRIVHIVKLPCYFGGTHLSMSYSRYVSVSTVGAVTTGATGSSVKAL